MNFCEWVAFSSQLRKDPINGPPIVLVVEDGEFQREYLSDLLKDVP